MLPERLRLLEAQRRRAVPSAPVTAIAGELVRLDDAEADAGVLLDLLLQVLGELLVALGGDHGQRVDLEAAQALAVLVHAQAQAAADGLAALALGADVAQRANLEDVRVVPALASAPSGRR